MGAAHRRHCRRMRNSDISISTHVSYCSSVRPISSTSSRVTSTNKGFTSAKGRRSTKTATAPTSDPFRLVRWPRRTRRAQDRETARLYLRFDEPSDAVPAKRVPAWIDPRDRFFRKRVHAHRAVEHALRSSREFRALLKQQAVLLVELELQYGGQLAARIGCGRICRWWPGPALGVG